MRQIQLIWGVDAAPRRAKMRASGVKGAIGLASGTHELMVTICCRCAPGLCRRSRRLHARRTTAKQSGQRKLTATCHGNPARCTVRNTSTILHTVPAAKSLQPWPSINYPPALPSLASASSPARLSPRSCPKRLAALSAPWSLSLSLMPHRRRRHPCYRTARPNAASQRSPPAHGAHTPLPQPLSPPHVCASSPLLPRARGPQCPHRLRFPLLRLDTQRNPAASKRGCPALPHCCPPPACARMAGPHTCPSSTIRRTFPLMHKRSRTQRCPHPSNRAVTLPASVCATTATYGPDTMHAARSPCCPSLPQPKPNARPVFVTNA